MCDAATAAAVIAIVGTGVQVVQAEDQRRQAEHFRQRKEAQEKSNALASMRIATAEIHEQQLLDHESASVEIQVNQRAANQAVAQATVTAGEAGAFGRSFEGLVGEFARQESEFEGAVHQNLAIKNQFAALNLQSAALTRDARLINASTLPTPRVDYVGYAVGGLNASFNLYSSFAKVGAAQTGRVSGGGTR